MSSDPTNDRSSTPSSTFHLLGQPQTYSPRKKDHSLSSKSKLKKSSYGPNYNPEEETIRNDYSQHYVATGSRPQNFIQNTQLETRFAEYPKLKKLLALKKQLVADHAHPPTYLSADLRISQPGSFNLLDLHPARFDVILLDPPLREYVDSHPELASDPKIASCGGPPGSERAWWLWEELEALPVPQIAASPGFIFLWCGSGQGTDLEQGRALLTKWGYRKCEDLVWVKTNHNSRSSSNKPSGQPLSVFAPTKEHCLMGIRGTVRRSTDGHFVHCNVDTDVIVAEPDQLDHLHKPEELYHLIENFCLGRRRLELFGSSRSLRPGWLTIGTECKPQPGFEHLPTAERPVPYQKDSYLSQFLDSASRTQNLLPSNAEIDNLRPRSPPGRITTTPLPGSSQALGLGLGYPGSATIPIIGPDGTLMAATISGRNTVSHPSGGLGRGPGNALLPGMRVSGVRDAGNHSSNNIRQVRAGNAATGLYPTSGHRPTMMTYPQPPMAYQYLMPQPPWPPQQMFYPSQMGPTMTPNYASMPPNMFYAPPPPNTFYQPVPQQFQPYQFPNNHMPPNSDPSRSSWTPPYPPSSPHQSNYPYYPPS